MNVEDACAFAWLQLLRHHPRQETAFGWLCTTAVREAIKLDRRARSGVELDGLGGDHALDPRLELDHRLEVVVARQAIERLTLRERRLVAPRVLGYSRRQMTELTSESDRALDRQLVRARRKLREAVPAAGEMTA